MPKIAESIETKTFLFKSIMINEVMWIASLAEFNEKVMLGSGSLALKAVMLDRKITIKRFILPSRAIDPINDIVR